MNPYEILGCSPMDDERTVKDKYRQLCKVYHPDNAKTGNREKFESIRQAWKMIEGYGFSRGFEWTHNTVFTIKRRTN